MNRRPARRRITFNVSVEMKLLISIILAISLSPAVAGESYPLREPEDGEGSPLWWWALWRDPVVVVRGSVEETEKPRPDLSVLAPWDTWRKLSAGGRGQGQLDLGHARSLPPTAAAASESGSLLFIRPAAAP